MIKLPYSLIIEATDEPNYFGFFSDELEGFSGIGHSIEDCIYKGRHGMEEHVALLRDRGLAFPPENLNPIILIRNEAKDRAA
ncbi:MAG: type II toxin-antitoxin system HicB family antitoxin [Candidatus Sumerlaeaceae bacterium]